MSTLKQKHFAPSEGTCYNPSTGMECTTTKSGKYSAKDWKKGSNVKHGKNDGKRMSEPERVMIKARLRHTLSLDGTETDGELIQLANENDIDINNLIPRMHAKDMLKKVKRAYNRNRRIVDDHEDYYLPHCTIEQLKEKLELLSEDPSASDFDKWMKYAESFTDGEQKLYKSRTRQLNFDTVEGWRRREGELDGESSDGGGCTIT